MMPYTVTKHGVVAMMRTLAMEDTNIMHKVSLDKSLFFLCFSIYKNYSFLHLVESTQDWYSNIVQWTKLIDMIEFLLPFTNIMLKNSLNRTFTGYLSSMG